MTARPQRGVLAGLTLTMTLAAALASTPIPAPAQSTQELQHRSTFPESFGFLQSVRELSDGRLVVADPLGGLLVALDPATGQMAPLGREGGGPGEWRQPDAVFPLAGDSTLLVDLGNARLSIIDPTGRFVDSHPMAMAPPGPGGIDILQPRATDAAGRIYYQGRRGVVGPGSAPRAVAPDSLEVRRWDRSDAAPVRLAGLRPPATTSTTSGGGGQMQVRMQPVPLAPQDDWAVAPDGRVALVRAEPYRVEWLQPDGRTVTGPVVDYRPVPVRTAEKERWLEGLGGGLSVAVTMQGGAPSTQFRRGSPMPAGARGSVQDYEWPDVLPAIRAGGARVDPNGRVWVERYGQAGSPTHYDVFDRNGNRVAQIRLPADRRVIGFGRDAVYAAHVDDLGLNWLETYEPPR